MSYSNNVKRSVSFSGSASVLSEGSSVGVDKGPLVLSCDGKGRTKNAYDLLQQDAYLRSKLFVQLEKQRSAFKEARSYGSIDFSSFDLSSIVDMGGRILPEEKLAVVPITRLNWREVVRTCMTQSGGTMLLGSTGLGKTFKIPEFIRAEYGCNVFLVLPNEDSAYLVWETMRSMGRRVVYDVGTTSLARYRDVVVVCTASVMMKRLVTSSESDFGECVMYLDEYHFGSASYDSLRRLVGTLRTGVKLFAATATLNEREQASRVGENTPRIHVKMMQRMSVVDLTHGRCPEDCHPMNVESGKWLYVLPNHTSLINFYKRSPGVDRYYMSERLSVEVNASSLKRYNEHNGSSPAIMFVTPEFGSMYNFDCDHVVDFGYTEDISLNSAYGVIRTPRYTTKGESRQRIGRLGRFGRAGTYYTWQDVDDNAHFAREDEVDTTIVDYYCGLYYALFNYRPNARHVMECTRSRALVLVECKIVSYIIRGMVGDTGGVHRFLRGAMCLFRRPISVDESLDDEGFSMVHCDIEKTSFVYHFEGKFPLMYCTEYSKMLVAVINPLVDRAVLRAEPLANMEQYRSVSEVIERRRSYCEDANRRSNVSVVDRCDRESSGSSSSSASSSVGTPVVAEFKSPNGSDHTKFEKCDAYAPISSEGMKESRYSVRGREVHQHTPDNHKSVVSMGGLDVIPEHCTPVPSYNIVSETPAPGIESEDTRNYHDYNREALSVIRKKIAISNDVCVPFMTLYQEPLGYRSVEEVLYKPRTPSYTVSELRRERLEIGMMYTPLLSRSVEMDYYTANESRKKKVIQWMDKPEQFFGASTHFSRRLDTFASVWNWTTNDYLSLMIRIRNYRSPPKTVDRIWEAVTLQKSIEERFEEKAMLLRRMADFYAAVLRPKDMLLVPYKSYKASAMTSQDVRRWSDGVPVNVFPVYAWMNEGWFVAPREFQRHKCKILRVLDSEEKGVGFAYMYKRDAIYVAAHTVGVSFDPEFMKEVGGTVLSLSGSGRYVELCDVGGERLTVSIDYASGQNEILRCSLVKVEEKGPCACRRIKPRSTYEKEMVRVLVPMLNPQEGVVELYASPLAYATFDVNSGIGICEVECVAGMSGAVVVSYNDNRPLGMVKAVNYGMGRSVMIFSIFPEVLLMDSVYGAFKDYMQ